MLTSFLHGLRMRVVKPAPHLAGYSLETRLYTIIGFLGLLPMLGVALAFLATSNSARDNGALDRAARRRLRLHRDAARVHADRIDQAVDPLAADAAAGEGFGKNLIR